MSVQAPYHRQFPEGPTIFVRNGFLDHADEDESVLAAKAEQLQERLRRAKSAPVELVELDSADDEEDDVETEVGSELTSRWEDAATAPSSPWQEAAAAPNTDDLVDEICLVQEELPPSWWSADFTLEPAALDRADEWSGGPTWVGPVPSPCPLTQGVSLMSAAAAPKVQQGSAHPSPQQSAHPSPQLSPQLAPQLSPECLQQLIPKLAQLPSTDDDSFVDLIGGPERPLQPHSIAQAVSTVSGMHRVQWTVDAAKLSGHERQAVSPAFELTVGQQTAGFRLILVPRAPPDVKGNASFKKAHGKGIVQVKCEAPRGVVSFWISITDGSRDFSRKPRGPTAHDFAWHSTCGLPKDQEQWDFCKAVDKASQTFTVCLDILPHTDI